MHGLARGPARGSPADNASSAGRKVCQKHRARFAKQALRTCFPQFTAHLRCDCSRKKEGACVPQACRLAREALVSSEAVALRVQCCMHIRRTIVACAYNASCVSAAKSSPCLHNAACVSAARLSPSLDNAACVCAVSMSPCYPPSKKNMHLRVPWPSRLAIKAHKADCSYFDHLAIERQTDCSGFPGMCQRLRPCSYGRKRNKGVLVALDAEMHRQKQDIVQARSKLRILRRQEKRLRQSALEVCFILCVWYTRQGRWR